LIKKVIKFEDFNGNEQTETHYFHMSKTELINTEFSHEGGLSTVLPQLVKEQNVAKLLEIVQSLIRKSYGKRSEDGRNFIKNAEQTEEFMNSAAYDALFTELVTSPDAATEFITGIIPKDLLKIVEGAAQEKQAADSQDPKGLLKKDPRSMTHDELIQALRIKTAQGSQE
jgi:hypothetical protein